MFTEKLENVLQFIEFLHSNIDTFSQYDENIEEVKKLDEVRNKLKPNESFEDKQQYDKISIRRKEQYQIISQNIIQPLFEKITELNICDFKFDYFEREEQQNVNENDLQRLKESKNKFLEYKKMKYSTLYSKTYLDDLDQLDQSFQDILKYFKIDENNELEQFKTNPTHINNSIELVQKLKQGEQHFSIPVELIGFNIGQTTQKQTSDEFIQPHQINKPKQKEISKSETKSIIFDNKETVLKIHDLLKGYFPDKENELLKVLNGEQVDEFLYFPHNQNKLVEFFGRVSYNNFILSNKTEIRDWICSNFYYKKHTHPKPHQFNKGTVYNILSKRKGEATKNQRICIVEWLPYKRDDEV